MEDNRQPPAASHQPPEGVPPMDKHIARRMEALERQSFLITAGYIVVTSVIAQVANFLNGHYERVVGVMLGTAILSYTAFRVFKKTPSRRHDVLFLTGMALILGPQPLTNGGFGDPRAMAAFAAYALAGFAGLGMRRTGLCLVTTLLGASLVLVLQFTGILESIRVVAVSSAPMIAALVADGFGMVMMLFMIGRYHRLQIELLGDAVTVAQQSKAGVERALATQQGFFRTIAHELRTPLNAVLGFGELIEKSAQLSGAPAGHLNDLQIAGKSLLGIVNDALDYLRIQTGEMEPDTEPFSLRQQMDQIGSVMTYQAAGKGLELVFEPLPPDAAGFLRGDTVWLKRMLFNLIGNAIKFTERGRVTVRVLDRGRAVDHQQLRFEVEDTGPGIPPQVLAHLFEEPRSGDTRRDRRHGGVGLGLVIVKGLAEPMGGSVEVASEVGKGSTFAVEIRLPITTEAAFKAHMVAGLIQELPGPQHLRLDGLRVLLVDDGEMNLSVARTLLEHEGVREVLVARGGEESIDALRQAEKLPDVVLMDVEMPGMDGIAATRAIRADERLSSLPIVGISAGEHHVADALAAGMNGFLAKPLVLDELLLAIREQVALARGEPLDAGRLRDEPRQSVETAGPTPALAGERYIHERVKYLRNFSQIMHSYHRYAATNTIPTTDVALQALVSGLRTLEVTSRHLGLETIRQGSHQALGLLRKHAYDEVPAALGAIANDIASFIQTLERDAAVD